MIKRKGVSKELQRRNAYIKKLTHSLFAYRVESANVLSPALQKG